MSEKLDKIIIALFIVFGLASLVIGTTAYSEGIYDDEFVGIPVYVTANHLNLRMSPGKTGYVVTTAEKGDILTATGEWSKDYRWIELYHAEYGYLWCDYHYVSEIEEPIKAETLWETPLKIRKQVVNGRVTGYLRRGREIEITQIILGWGKCRVGWIDLEYCILIGEDEDESEL